MVVVVVVVDVGVAVSVAFRRAVRTGLSMPMKCASEMGYSQIHFILQDDW